MSLSNKKSSAISEAILIIISLQALREILEYFALKTVPSGKFSERMVSMSVMLILICAFLFYARIRKAPLSVFPPRFGLGYVIFTCAAAVVFITAPSNYTGGFQPIMLLIYGSIVTPVFEELIFRGYLWNRLNSAMRRESYTFLWSVALFTLWHLGYMIPQLLSGNWTAVLWKLAAGAGYGTVLGFLRIKTKNCYATMLAHGILNVFMI